MNDIHMWINNELFATFGPLDPHHRHVLLMWTIGIFVGLTIIEMATEWWKRRK